MAANRSAYLRVCVLAGLLVLAGCVQITVHSTVAADGTIEEYQLQMNMSRQVYGFIEQSAEDEGYDSVRESFLADVNGSNAEEIEYDEEFQGDQVSLTITAHNFEPDESSNISITEQDGNLVYEDLTFVNESADGTEESELSRSITSTMSVDYYLTMPGEIMDSNADEVDGNTAEWHESGLDAFEDNRIYAESELPASTGLPGFGFGLAILALTVIVGAAIVYSRTH